MKLELLSTNVGSLQGPYHHAVPPLMRDLPDSRFDKIKRRWTFYATPAGCHKLIGELSNAGLDLDIDAALEQAAQRWASRVERLNALRAADHDFPMTQPEGLRTTLWRHQRKAFHFAKEEDAAGLSMFMGTGKSLTTLALLCYWKSQRILVACPKAVIGVWRRETEKHAPGVFRTICLDKGTGATKAIHVRNAVNLYRGPTMIVANYESIITGALCKELMSHEWDAVIADESHRCFPRGTMVMTPHGERPIESLREGDVVLGEREGQVLKSRVVGLHRNTATRLVHRGPLSGTATHPIWTPRGYLSLQSIGDFDTMATIRNPTQRQVEYEVVHRLRSGVHPEGSTRGLLLSELLWKSCDQVANGCSADHQVQAMRRSVQAIEQHAEVLLSSMFENASDSSASDKEVRALRRRLPPSTRDVAILLEELQADSVVHYEAGASQQSLEGYEETYQAAGLSGGSESVSVLRPQSISQSNGGKRSEAEGVDRAERQAMGWSKGRQWSPIIGGSREARRSAGLAYGSSDQNDDASQQRVSWLLQSRHCKSLYEDFNRGRWSVTQEQVAKVKRRQENSVSDQHRMDLPAIYQSTDSERSANGDSYHPSGIEVFNIETETGNYFANGVLVHNCKGAGTKTSKTLYALGKQSKKRLALSGTMMTQGPIDLYGQFRFLDAGVFGTSATRFRDKYCITNAAMPHVIMGYKNQDDLKSRFEQMAIVVTLDDADLDLPELTHERVHIQLDPATQKIHDSILRDSVAKFGDIDAAIDALIDDDKTHRVTAGNILVQLLRLNQVTGGYVTDDDEKITRLSDEKKQALKEIVEDLPEREPIVVFCRFREDIRIVSEVAAETGKRYGEISGGRKDLTPHSTLPTDVDLVAVQWQSGGAGIDLSRASYGVVYSSTYSGGDFNQGISRLHRPGQTRPTKFYHLVCTGTVDEKIYKALDRKKKLIERITSNVDYA